MKTRIDNTHTHTVAIYVVCTATRCFAVFQDNTDGVRVRRQQSLCIYKNILSCLALRIAKHVALASGDRKYSVRHEYHIIYISQTQIAGTHNVLQSSRNKVNYI